ncbi:MAG TPA: hypothetical protein VHM26_18280 [Chitinophagaceae bacterium]|jgi:hypothetical protein|nr:hypothetical protein [Chitinophagaceae bacterium]
MYQVIALLVVLYILYSGIQFLLIAFGYKTPRFKSFEQEQRFMNVKKKYGLWLKIGSIILLVSFIGELISSGALKWIFAIAI